ncbi:MAG TPA: lipopolysaccharide biosynthesis protein [Vicinamibacterales bacterium]|nr:lipopolysaccharide biosynthesis protein [Vicinamibacterales bacterium]
MFQKIRELSRNLAIYGLGDVAISVVNFLLLPLYVQYLSPDDYGALGLLGSVEVIAKIFFRWGLDGSFMRFFYECDDARARQRLASTIFFFLLAVNGVLLLLAFAAAPALARFLFDAAAGTDPPHLFALQLTLLNTFVIGFTFFPFHILRMEQRALQFSALTLARSVATVGLRLVLIVGLGYGVLGVVVADIVVTSALMAVLLRWFAPIIRPVFSRTILRETLRFGLPRVPHAAAQQVIAVGDKIILTAFRPLHEVGLYSMGVSFGLTQKLFLSAFEYAWAPFYYANSREPDAKRLFSSMTTYGLAVLSLMTAGLSAIGGDLLALVVGPPYVPAADVVTWTAVGVLFQGAYLLTSIGLNITKNTQYYAASTAVAAAVNVLLNFALIPRFGLMGAAWANAVAYAVQAALAFRFSQQVYPVAYESRRIAAVASAGLIGFLAARALPSMPPAAGVLVRGLAVVAVYVALLGVTGFFRQDELRALAALRRRRRTGPLKTRAPEVTELGGEIVAAELPDEDAATPATPGAGR